MRASKMNHDNVVASCQWLHGQTEFKSWLYYLLLQASYNISVSQSSHWQNGDDRTSSEGCSNGWREEKHKASGTAPDRAGALLCSLSLQWRQRHSPYCWCDVGHEEMGVNQVPEVSEICCLMVNSWMWLDLRESRNSV